MTNPKLEKYNKEREKIAARLAVLQSRKTELDSKITELENLEIRALMQTESMTLTDLMDLVRSMQEKKRAAYPSDTDELKHAYNEEETP